MPSRTAILEISPSRVELTVLAGRSVAATKSQRIASADYTENWSNAVSVLVPVIRSLVAAVSAHGLKTTVIYQSPTAFVLAVPVPSRVGSAEAYKAARLALADASNLSLTDNPADFEVLCSDPKGSKDDSAAAQTHFLSVADAERTVAALGAAMTEAGLVPVRMIPADAIGFHAAVESALERSRATSKCCVSIMCGEQGSVLAAATGGKLRLVRRIGIGCETFIETLTRDIRVAGSDTPLKLDATQASELLFRSGLPARGQPYDATLRLEPEAVLPLVQPVLQRCIVEIRQSLRFGLEEKDRVEAGLIVRGIGGNIHRLSNLIGEQCGLTPIECVLPTTDQKSPSSTERGLIRHLLDSKSLLCGLLPSAVRNQMTARRVKRGMLVGFAAAAVALGFSAFNASVELKEVSKRVESARVALEHAKPLAEMNTKMISAQSGVTLARQRIESKLGHTAAWDAALVMLSQCTPPTIKIGDVQMVMEKGKPTCRITGHTPLPSSGDYNASLGPYLDAIGSNPVVKSTRLGSTQRADSPKGPIQSFEITITLVEIPGTGVDRAPGIASAPQEKEAR